MEIPAFLKESLLRLLQMRCSHAILLAVVLVAVYVTTEARYLPTRSQDDRLDRLRELLRDVSYISYVLPVTDLNPGYDVQNFQLNDQWSEITSVFNTFIVQLMHLYSLLKQD